MKKKTILAIYLLFLLFFYSTNSQPVVSGEPTETEIDEEISPETICFKYQFLPKDTLIYKLEALDSISTLESEPFFRQRTEYVMVIIDSIDKNRNYYLKYETIEYKSKEWIINGDTVNRSKSNHVGRKSLIVIDSLGNRLISKNLNTETALTNPGGLFQPILFFPLVETCKKQLQSWLIKTSDTLVENSFPPAVLNSTSLMKISKIQKEDTDTSILITFVRTGRGLYAIMNNELDLELSSVTNSYGELTVSLSKNLPIKYFMTQELKVKLKVNEEAEKPTWQNTIITYELVKQSHNDRYIQEEINKMRKELKRSR